MSRHEETVTQFRIKSSESEQVLSFRKKKLYILFSVSQGRDQKSFENLKLRLSI